MSKDQAQARLDEKKEIVITLSQTFADPATAGLSLMVLFTTVGGLALAVFGLGLQSDKPRASLAAVVTAALWLLILIAAGICLWVGSASIVAKIWNLVLILIAALLLGFALVAWKQVRQFPPPPGLDILPPDFEIPKFRH